MMDGWRFIIFLKDNQQIIFIFQAFIPKLPFHVQSAKNRLILKKECESTYSILIRSMQKNLELRGNPRSLFKQ